MRPQVLIFVDDVFHYGLEQGMYPDLANKVRYGLVQVEKLSDFKDGLWNIDKLPFGGEDIYFLNPYTEQYQAVGNINEDEASLQMKLVTDKATVIKEAFVRMGAKIVEVVDSVKDTETNKMGAEASGGKGGCEAGAELDKSKDLSVKIDSTIKSEDPNREPKSYEEVKKYVVEHGLGDDTCIATLLSRLKSDGRISGSEHYECTFLSELKSSLDIAAHVNTPLIHGSAKFGSIKSGIHEISKTIHLEF